MSKSRRETMGPPSDHWISAFLVLLRLLGCPTVELGPRHGSHISGLGVGVTDIFSFVVTGSRPRYTLSVHLSAHPSHSEYRHSRSFVVGSHGIAEDMLTRGESVLSRVCLAFTRRVRWETALRTAVIAEWSWQRESAYSGVSADGVSPSRQNFCALPYPINSRSIIIFMRASVENVEISCAVMFLRKGKSDCDDA